MGVSTERSAGRWPALATSRVIDRRPRGLGFLAAAAAVAVVAVTPAAAAVQRQDTAQDTTRTPVYRINQLVVTATRTAKPLFLTPAPVAVIDSARLRELRPNTITDVLRELPGVDVTGVGVQQPRPIIRGQRGQRILLLEDGLRLNNSRRQQDFGEVPSLVDPSQVARVEVVRGPASVLYGTDAIGGVINVITDRTVPDGWHGRAGYLFGAEEEQHRGVVALSGRSGAWSVLANAAAREAGSYKAPAGRFGDIELDSATSVNGTGIEDWNASLRAGWDVGAGHHLFVRGERYESKAAGFGFIEPSAYAPELPRIEIRYPDQQFTRVSLGWEANGLNLPFADRAEIVTYVQDNQRTLSFDLFQSFGPGTPPGAGVQINTLNDSDLRTLGLRAEAKKLIGPVLLTWGADIFRDRSENTDSSETVVVGFGPPQREVNTTPLVPNATYRSMGAFAQGELTAGNATFILGGRVQDVQAEAEPGPNVPANLASKGRSTVVGAANLLYALSDRITLVGSVGRGFRAPNLIEWFFEGPTPEGSGYQVRSLDLEPETSINVDVGVRYRDSRVAFEAFAFRNSVRNGVRIEPTGQTVQGFPAFRNVNLDKLLYRGIEVAAEATLPAGFTVLGTYTALDSEDELDPSNPIGDSYSSKITGALRWSDARDRFRAEYAVRHNGERQDVALVDNPAGNVLPAFTVHALRASFALPLRTGLRQRIGLALENLTNELYAEASNTSFFRPEPRRRITLNYEVSF